MSRVICSLGYRIDSCPGLREHCGPNPREQLESTEEGNLANSLGVGAEPSRPYEPLMKMLATKQLRPRTLEPDLPGFKRRLEGAVGGWELFLNSIRFGEQTPILSSPRWWP